MPSQEQIPISSALDEDIASSSAIEEVEGMDDELRPTLLKRSSSLFSLSQGPPLPPPNESDYIGFFNDTRHFNMIRSLHLADFITCLNGFSGFYSIISCLRFTLTNKPHYVQRAHFFILLGLFFDFFDGRVARLRNRSSLMGQELDSLADLISFCVAPASIAFSLGIQTTVDVLLLTFFVLCGLTRLARFNVTVNNIPKDKGGKSKYFEGLPVPTSLALVGLMAYLVYKGQYESELGLPFGTWLTGSFFEFHPFSCLFFFHGCMMISKSLHVPKP
ncbi:CDP-diacylglycerol-serine O-phosphatidyltransferase [Saccharomycopsis crataegensis]|uniref:CDP-diacylglycerol--serine O-phosphatidyltransferase n=1 Tax=Saccharomycopsis crataegensis TaxID=43959 RepID=A0AAV5QEY0_9ASCO|nr:CDP-diacylglycerol-serine O-phosphatidyltransferase [Saccharomycopsis crataegensis]